MTCSGLVLDLRDCRPLTEPPYAGMPLEHDLEAMPQYGFVRKLHRPTCGNGAPLCRSHSELEDRGGQNVMNSASHDTTICCLCGKPITCRDSGSDEALSMDHVPPKQFYPKSTRTEKNLNLWVVPTHRRCNGGYKNDEEYFYHSLSPLARDGSPRTGQTIFRDLARRATQPQTRVLIRGLLSTSRTETRGGILLPPGDVGNITSIACVLRYRETCCVSIPEVGIVDSYVETNESSGVGCPCNTPC